MTIKIEAFKSEDTESIVELFRDTVHHINSEDYDSRQIASWAPETIDVEKWQTSLGNNETLVAKINDIIIGFIDIDDKNYLDHLYVHKDYQRQSIASSLLQSIEKDKQGTITTDSSITARPFFEKHGFKVIREQTVQRDGIELINYKMEKQMR